MRCGGPLGCTAGPLGVVCDDSVGSAGDACSVEGHAACTPDKQAALSCNEHHRFELLQSCGGAMGCAFSSGLVQCDDSVASVGDPCARNGQVSCSLDGLAALVCEAGVFSRKTSCDGPNHCRKGDAVIECDRRVSVRDDPCDREGDLACSQSGSALLSCSGGHYVVRNSCDGPGGCVVRGAPRQGDGGPGDSIVCDDSVAVADEPCAAPGEPACSVDGKSYLTCGENHLFAHGEDCTHEGCKYDARRDMFLCDHRVVSSWPASDVRSVLGAWILNWAGSKTPVLISREPEGSLYATFRDGNSHGERARATFRDGTLRFDDASRPNHDYRHQFRLEGDTLVAADRTDGYAPRMSRE